MNRLFSVVFAVLFVFSINHFAQIPVNTLVQIVKAEDERRFDSTLENLLKNADAKVRERTVLAIGRIGEENSIPSLNDLLATEKDEKVRVMIMFALGEIESAKASETILQALSIRNAPSDFIARAIEAAGKIAAANPKDENSKKLGSAILEQLNFEDKKRSAPYTNVVLLGITAVLRARPEGSDKIVAEFLRYSDARIRADALNTLARLRSKSVNAQSRELLKNDKDAVVRANAARMLGVGEDKESLDLLLNAAIKDEDSRVRVSAIRALASLKDASVAEKLITGAVGISNKGKILLPSNGRNIDKSEFLEIATTLGRLLPNTNNQQAITYLSSFNRFDDYNSPEIISALIRISPIKYGKYVVDLITPDKTSTEDCCFGICSENEKNTAIKGITELASIPASEEINQIKELAEKSLFGRFGSSDLLTAYSALKPKNLSVALRSALKSEDSFVRATAAGLLDNQPSSKENIEALKTAFTQALLQDKHDNDAQLAILDALFKLDKKESVGTLLTALNAPDYLVRKKAFQLLKTEGLEKDYPGLPTMLENFIAKKKNQVLPYSPAFGTKLGQVLNSNADYIRAVSRKNGTVKAVFTTSKGVFTINLTPEDAPLTVDNFIKLANANYFNGVSVHRVVPNFVMQDGDPRGDGNGGPGWSIRCEVNMLEYGRGAVGMALSGKDTGGSPWFATHSPQPHLDGGYTVFGQVNETDMKVVDSIVRGDKIISVKIIGDSVKKSIKKSK